MPYRKILVKRFFEYRYTSIDTLGAVPASTKEQFRNNYWEYSTQKEANLSTQEGKKKNSTCVHEIARSGMICTAAMAAGADSEVVEFVFII